MAQLAMPHSLNINPLGNNPKGPKFSKQEILLWNAMQDPNLTVSGEIPAFGEKFLVKTKKEKPVQFPFFQGTLSPEEIDSMEKNHKANMEKYILEAKAPETEEQPEPSEQTEQAEIERCKADMEKLGLQNGNKKK